MLRRGSPPEGRHHGAVSGWCDITNFAIMPYHTRQKNPPGMCFACDCAHPLSNSAAAKQGDTGAPEGDLRQREKHPPTTLETLREVIRDHRVLFRRGHAGMTTPPSVVDGCAKPSVDGMAPQESGVITWRHRFRRRRARLAPLPGRNSCDLPSHRAVEPPGPQTPGKQARLVRTGSEDFLRRTT